jgi:hypothetical protein
MAGANAKPMLVYRFVIKVVLSLIILHLQLTSCYLRFRQGMRTAWSALAPIWPLGLKDAVCKTIINHRLRRPDVAEAPEWAPWRRYE